jgi:hypothetical protein
VVDVAFQNMNRVLETAQGINFKTEFAISDQFIVFKNVSKAGGNPSSIQLFF